MLHQRAKLATHQENPAKEGKFKCKHISGTTQSFKKLETQNRGNFRALTGRVDEKWPFWLIFACLAEWRRPRKWMIAWLTRNMLEMSANGLEIDCGAFIACGQINLSRQSIWINKLATERGNFYSRKKTNKLDLLNIYSMKINKLDLLDIYSRKKTNKLDLKNIC